MSIVDELIESPGVYLGIGRDPQDERDQPHGQAARVVVSVLPGRAGVTIDYETFDPASPGRLRPHLEHAIIGRTADGRSILVSGHNHADTVAVLRETSRGQFAMGDEPGAFPMAIDISVPEAGRLVYVWSFAEPGQQPVPRDRAELELQA